MCENEKDEAKSWWDHRTIHLSATGGSGPLIDLKASPDPILGDLPSLFFTDDKLIKING